MDSTTAALSGSFVACYRFLIDVDGIEENEKTVVINAKGIDNALSLLYEKGYTFNQVLNYTVC